MIIKRIHEFASKREEKIAVLFQIANEKKNNQKWRIKSVQNIPPEFINCVRKHLQRTIFLSDVNLRHHNISQTYGYQ